MTALGGKPTLGGSDGGPGWTGRKQPSLPGSSRFQFSTTAMYSGRSSVRFRRPEFETIVSLSDIDISNTKRVSVMVPGEAHEGFDRQARKVL